MKHRPGSKSREKQKLLEHLEDREMLCVIYSLGVQLDVLHRLRLGKQQHLLDDVHLIVGVDGLMELPVI